ncbi:MAG: hypothetical protein K0S26_945 [Bacteroidota bacterium]|jgi:hypothetical protein|nr:hypothetical protein [Bacteroidota bacterium]
MLFYEYILFLTLRELVVKIVIRSAGHVNGFATFCTNGFAIVLLYN